MGRSRNGQAVPPERGTPEAIRELTAFAESARQTGRVDVWVRARAILTYIAGERVVNIARNLGKGRATINDWLRWYAREGCEGLRAAWPVRLPADRSPAYRVERDRG